MPTRAHASLLAVAAFAAVLAGCGGGGADETMETARFEELQNNPAHARQLYEDVVRRYPGSPQAAEAATRLRALDEKK